jgi:DNA polymerase III alpha subunit
MTIFNIELHGHRNANQDSADSLRACCNPSTASMKPGCQSRWNQEVEVFDRKALISSMIQLNRLSRDIRGAGHSLQVVGAAAGSMAFHAMGLSPICPVEHVLYLERFVDPRDCGKPQDLHLGGMVSMSGVEFLKVLRNQGFALRVFEHDAEVNGRKERVETIGAKQPGEKRDGARIILQVAAPSILAVTTLVSTWHEDWMSDERTWELLASGDTDGIPNLDAPADQSTLRRLKPRTLKELAKVMVMNRPGQTEDEQTRHPVYQDDLMTMLHQAGDFSLREAYELVRTLAKNKPDVTDASKKQFLKCAENRGLDQEKASLLWERVRAESLHALCKAHIYVTAFNSLQVAFVKAHQPDEFQAVIAAMKN